MTDMEMEMVEQIARIDGWREAFPRDPELCKDRGGILLPYHYEQLGTGKRIMTYPDYLNSRDAIVPVIEKVWPSLSGDKKWKFCQSIGVPTTHIMHENYTACLFIAPHQLCVALLTATGKNP